MSNHPSLRFPSDLATLRFWDVDSPSLYNAPAHTMASALKRVASQDHREAGSYIAEASPAVQQDLQGLSRQWALMAASQPPLTPRQQMGLMIGQIAQRVDYASQLSAEELGGGNTPSFMAIPSRKYRVLGRGIGKTIEMEHAGDRLGLYLGGVARVLETFHDRLTPAKGMVNAAPIAENRVERPEGPKPTTPGRGGLRLIISR